MKCFVKICREKDLPVHEIANEVSLLGNTRVDFLFDREVTLEVKFEPDYPNMPETRKPVTNTVLKSVDEKIAQYAEITYEESQMRLYETELDFLKQMAHKKAGYPYNYLFCLDEDGRLYRSLGKSLRTKKIREQNIFWKSIKRGIDNQWVYYFLWAA